MLARGRGGGGSRHRGAAMGRPGGRRPGGPAPVRPWRPRCGPGGPGAALAAPVRPSPWRPWSRVRGPGPPWRPSPWRPPWRPWSRVRGPGPVPGRDAVPVVPTTGKGATRRGRRVPEKSAPLARADKSRPPPPLASLSPVDAHNFFPYPVIFIVLDGSHSEGWVWVGMTPARSCGRTTTLRDTHLYPPLLAGQKRWVWIRTHPYPPYPPSARNVGTGGYRWV